jgi:two-component system response regulator YesN
MYKVIIVEDEMLVRIGLKNLIDWRAYDMEVIADEPNGQAALEAFEREPPHIVITDVRMPLMDGIRLISEIRQRDDNQTKIIILTCVEDFKTVHSALTMGVAGYIMKLSMNKEELGEMLTKLKLELDTRKVAPVKSNHNANLQMQKDELLNNYLFTKRYTKEEFKKYLHGFNPEISETKMFLSVIEVDRIKDARKRYGHLLVNMLRNVVAESLSDIRDAEGFTLDGDRLAILASYRSESSELIIAENVRVMLSNIQKNISQTLKLTVSIGTSGQGQDFSQLLEMYTQAIEAMQLKFITSTDLSHDYSRIKQVMAEAKSVGADRITPFAEKYEKLIGGDIIAKLRDILLDSDVVPSRMINKAIQWMHLTVSRLSLPSSLSDELLNRYIKLVQESETLDEVVELLERYMEDLLKGLDGISREIVRARLYIHEHYSQPFSLDQVAQHVGLSSNYFSHLFKKELGINFVEYVVTYRVDKAKELLGSTPHKLYEIAELVGFNDSTYFSRAFKRITGKSPMDYVKRNR